LPYFSINGIVQQYTQTPAARAVILTLLPFDAAFALPKQQRNQIIITIEEFDEVFDSHG
jgi:hypothetical protein